MTAPAVEAATVAPQRRRIAVGKAAHAAASHVRRVEQGRAA
ncbi:hypothetical protein [Streptomyces zaomyceticus]